MDLRDALNEAVNKTRLTEDLSSLNRHHLEENQVQGGWSFCAHVTERVLKHANLVQWILWQTRTNEDLCERELRMCSGAGCRIPVHFCLVHFRTLSVMSEQGYKESCFTVRAKTAA